MKFTRFFLISFSLFFVLQNIEAQSYPKNYFRSPLDIPLVLAGTFGELRNNHFHSGIDIKTQGKTGLKVRAAADGYVVRIKVSPWGYGNALYIRHPNGYTTVYGHLEHFIRPLDSLARAVEYKHKRFAVDFYPEAGKYRVKKGQVIAYSGNSGSSGGPHLHFEIRDGGAHPVNPLLFGIKVDDNIRPTVKALRIYNLPKGFNAPLVKEFTFSSKQRPLSLRDTITVADRFYLAVNSFDRLTGANNKNGLYSYSAYLDGKMHFEFKARRLDFSLQRYINAYIDYGEFYQNKNRFQRTVILPGNRLKVYGAVRDSGIFILGDSLAHRIKIVAADFAGNRNVIEFYVKKGPIPVPRIHYPAPDFKWNASGVLESKNASFKVSAGSFYEDIYLHISEMDNKYSPFSKLVRIGKPTIPMQKYAVLSIRPDSNLPESLHSKAALARLNRKNIPVYAGGEYKDGMVVAKTRYLGSFLVAVDTVAPEVKPVNFFNGKNIANIYNLKLNITDDFSGIAKYDGYVNGKWVLGKYDPKKQRIWFPIDGHFPKGKFEFKVVVKDDKNNLTVKKWTLER